mgnify:CR=1 FL=1
MAKIYLNAEHGGTDSGATANGIREDEANLKVAKYAREYLSGYDCTTVMSRETDKALSINERVAQVRAQKPNLVITIAHNAGGGDGCEVFYWHTDSKAKAFAQELIKQFQAIGQNSRWVKPSQPGSYNFGMCREPAAMGIPAVLGEFAFLDNKADVVLVDSDADLKREGEAYGKAIVNYLGLKKKAEPPKPSPGGGSGVITVGSTVKVSGAKYATGQTIPQWVKNTTHEVSQISGDRALLGHNGGINSWVYLKDLALVSGGAAQPENLYAKGRAVRLDNVALYGSATTKTAAGRKTGTYYLYDGKEINGRYRITNSAANCGRTPTGSYITGYINKADIR